MEFGERCAVLWSRHNILHKRNIIIEITYARSYDLTVNIGALIRMTRLLYAMGVLSWIYLASLPYRFSRGSSTRGWCAVRRQHQLSSVVCSSICAIKLALLVVLVVACSSCTMQMNPNQQQAAGTSRVILHMLSSAALHRLRHYTCGLMSSVLNSDCRRIFVQLQWKIVNRCHHTSLQAHTCIMHRITKYKRVLLLSPRLTEMHSLCSSSALKIHTSFPLRYPSRNYTRSPTAWTVPLVYTTVSRCIV